VLPASEKREKRRRRCRQRRAASLARTTARSSSSIFSLSLPRPARWLHYVAGALSQGPCGGIDGDAMEGEKDTRARRKRTVRDRRGHGARKREREKVQSKRKDGRSPRWPRASLFPSLFFPCRVITSLSARQLRRKKSSNNHIYGAAASLRCIDPRWWPRGEEGGGEGEERASLSVERNGKRKGRHRRGAVGQKERWCFVRIEVLRAAPKPGFFRPMQQPFDKTGRITALVTRKSMLPAWTLTTKNSRFMSGV